MSADKELLKQLSSLKLGVVVLLVLILTFIGVGAVFLYLSNLTMM